MSSVGGGHGHYCYETENGTGSSYITHNLALFKPSSIANNYCSNGWKEEGIQRFQLQVFCIFLYYDLTLICIKEETKEESVEADITCVPDIQPTELDEFKMIPATPQKPCMKSIAFEDIPSENQ